MADRTLELDAELKQEGYGFSLSTDDVAQVLKLHERTVRKLASDGQLKASHVGTRARLRFVRKEVARYIARCEDDGESDSDE